jgi:hypothetical protein
MRDYRKDILKRLEKTLPDNIKERFTNKIERIFQSLKT